MSLIGRYKKFRCNMSTEYCYRQMVKDGKAGVGFCGGQSGCNNFMCDHYIERFSIERYNRDFKKIFERSKTMGRIEVTGDANCVCYLKNEDGSYSPIKLVDQEPELVFERVNEEEMSDEELINELKCMMNSTTADSRRDKVLQKAIERIQEKKDYPEWIYGDFYTSAIDFDVVEKALGFKLFFWQKTYICGNGFRSYGETTAKILKDLLYMAEDEVPLIRPNYGYQSRREKFYWDELMRIKTILNKAGVKTRDVK